MIDRSQFNAEDFLVDSTFQQFCAGTEKLCVEYWEKYISAHPEQASVIAEAKRLHFILSGNKRSLNIQVELLKQNFDTEKKNLKLNRNYNWLKIAAAVFLVASIGFLYENYSSKKEVSVAAVARTFSTKSGERKKITLSDGSTVLLNAKSSISINARFNQNNREVVLNGEAYFDVVHNKDKPFKVHTNEFNINVLGTAFNVRAYSDEISSEATLIRGLITMEAVNGNGGTITLKPSQKVTFYKTLSLKKKRRF